MRRLSKLLFIVAIPKNQGGIAENRTMMRKGKIVLLMAFIAFVFSANAADTIIVVKDARLDILTGKQVLVNKRLAMLTPSGLYKGFRIQVISTSNREDAFRIKADLLSKFPDQKTYMVYQSPNFKVRIGNYLKKEEAEKFKAQLNKLFPQGVYIVEDGIEYTPKEGEDILSQ